MTKEAECFERACEWFMELRENPDSQEVVTGWLEWCRADPVNRAAFERAREVWRATEVRTADLELLRARSMLPRRNRRVVFWGSGIAASLIVAITLFIATGLSASPVLTTPTGTNRSERLMDGSIVVLGADSRIRASFSGHSRHLILEQGEAYFRVTRDRNRPFTVSAGGVRVTAIGTAFNVRTAPDRVVVAVSDGAVAIDPAAKATRLSVKPNTRVSAGRQVVIDVAERSTRVTTVEPNAVASWQHGQLQFTREPLRAVLASINRYSDRHVELEDPALGELRFTGTVFSDRVHDWLRGLPSVFPVRLREETARFVVATREEN